MKNFVYKKVLTLEEACGFLAQNPKKAKVIAGGTDLLIQMKRRVSNPEMIVDLKGISGLDRIDHDKDKGLTIGALTTLRALETSGVVQEKFKVISECAGLMGSLQIRNLATVGGNICNASPSADMACCLMSLGASATIARPQGDRSLSLDTFFTGSGKTVLNGDEVLVSIQVPNIPARTGCAYLKHGIRKAMEIAIVSVAVKLTLDSANKKCEGISIILGSVAPIPMRAKEAEGRLRGEKIDKASIEEASKVASGECRPITDVRGSAAYRKEMIRVFTGRAIRHAIKSIR